MCRAGSSLAAHMLGYTGKTLVWWELAKRALTRAFSVGCHACSCWVPVAAKVI